jgi:hypothetical protein
MRNPKYLSPSSLGKYEQNRREFYEKYLCDIRKSRTPQMDFMAVGSALDAFTKHQIHRDVFGEEATKGTMYERDTIFEAQVEEHVRDVARERGEDLFAQYNESGAYGALLGDIVRSPYAPEMEFTVQGEVEGVPLLGKPDLRYITKGGVHVICDWKVNGSTSKTGASPFKGYQIARDVHNSNTNGKAHKGYVAVPHKDVEVQDIYLEDKCDYWADQLAIYSWLLGEPVGSEDFVVRMEQIACRPVKTRDLPRAKFATHMNRISASYQQELLTRITTCWATIQDGHIFTDMNRKESDELCELLDGKAAMPVGLHPALASYQQEGNRFK